MISRNTNEQEKFRLERTPTRFGRVTLDVEPLANSTGWKAEAVLDLRQRPSTIEVSGILRGRKFDRIEGSKYQANGEKITVDPIASRWTAFWR